MSLEHVLLKSTIFAMILMIIGAIGVVQLSYATDSPTHLFHFNKGQVDEKSVFAGEVIWTMIDNDKGVIVHSSDHGVVVVRFSISPSDACIDLPAAICLDGKVTKFKNTDSHNLGEEIKIIIDVINNKETISMINGPLEGVDVQINLEKIRIPEADDIAKRFVFSAPTFSFDGMPESVSVEEVVVLESFPPQHVVEINFDSRHGGYGDRTDQIVTQVITPHTIRITIVNGMITSAVIDGVWDELNSRPFLKPEK